MVRAAQASAQADMASPVKLQKDAPSEDPSVDDGEDASPKADHFGSTGTNGSSVETEMWGTDRRARKNIQARARSAVLKKRCLEIQEKPEVERTEEEKSILLSFEERRSKKNDRSRERALEKKEEIDRILSKPEKKRTKLEKTFLEQALTAKTRKNEGDRNRRRVLKNMGVPSKVGLKQAMIQGHRSPPGGSPYGYFPAPYPPPYPYPPPPPYAGANDAPHTSGYPPPYMHYYPPPPGYGWPPPPPPPPHGYPGHPGESAEWKEGEAPGASSPPRPPMPYYYMYPPPPPPVATGISKQDPSTFQQSGDVGGAAEGIEGPRSGATSPHRGPIPYYYMYPPPPPPVPTADGSKLDPSTSQLHEYNKKEENGIKGFPEADGSFKKEESGDSSAVGDYNGETKPAEGEGGKVEQV